MTRESATVNLPTKTQITDNQTIPGYWTSKRFSWGHSNDEIIFRCFSSKPLNEQALWVNTDIFSHRIRERYQCVPNYLKSKAIRYNFTLAQTAESERARA